MDKRLTLYALALLATAIVAAAVFAYYPLTVTVTPVSPPVTFVAGSNAGQPDLGDGNTISVGIGSNNASASVTIHPTYQRTYYRDVLRVKNSDSKAYDVYLRLNSVSNNLPGSTVKLYIYSDGSLVTSVVATGLSVGDTVYIGSLVAGATWRIDIEVTIPEGTSISGASATFSFNLIYTPSGETPP